MMSTDLGMDGITSAEGRLLSVQMGALRDDVREVKGTIAAIAQSLQQLVRMEEQQKDMRATISRAFDEIKESNKRIGENSKRLSEIENQIPGYRELRRWVIGGVFSGVAMIASALVYQIITMHVK